MVARVARGSLAIGRNPAQWDQAWRQRKCSDALLNHRLCTGSIQRELCAGRWPKEPGGRGDGLHVPVASLSTLWWMNFPILFRDFGHVRLSLGERIEPSDGRQVAAAANILAARHDNAMNIHH
jgi:hypothetical protein